eukprot:gnl/MRDRNA2_/MRDRNA2_77084_c0_seq1.p1 gnl/MRDRNA2_/MRDRNA2_77084_c0~~gnl/MRDRNA2_/MRDRNA2_77084_c0_seq1.p1  ORF type:complete len:101 (+),score=10.84 gnl/MRDRNA2_/MRDRNA2_77084_c0_seq1:68-370(+)
MVWPPSEVILTSTYNEFDTRRVAPTSSLHDIKSNVCDTNALMHELERKSGQSRLLVTRLSAVTALVALSCEKCPSKTRRIAFASTRLAISLFQWRPSLFS